MVITRHTRRAPAAAGGLAVLVAVFLSARAATADAPQVRAALDWDEATGCLDAESLVQGVESQLGRPAFAGTSDLRIVGRVSHAAGDAVDVELELRSADGRPLGVRTLRAAHGGCRALDRELVAVVALLIDLTEEELEEASGADGGVDADAGSDADAGTDAGADAGAVADAGTDAGVDPGTHRDAGSDAASHRSLSVELVAGATAAVREVPGLGVGVRLGAELRPLPEVPVELGVALFGPARAETAGAGASFWLAQARAGACLVARAGPLELGGCAGLDVGALLAVGYGLEATASPLRPWAAVSLRARVALRFGDFALRLEPGLAVPLVRDRFVFYDGAAQVVLFQAGPVAGTVDLVLAWQVGS